jgi:16S rRNA (guanine527-N7)-methyltransferase
LLEIGQPPLVPSELQAMEDHLALLLRWNAKVNLTAIRDEESILQRHYVESIICARELPRGVRTLLDFGSGGGFPGLPCAVCRPEMRVTLAESQAKKAAFLRESVRLLKLDATVYQGRVERLDRGIKFDVVTLRAVDHMNEACREAILHVKEGGWVAVLSSRESAATVVTGMESVSWKAPQPIFGTEQRVLMLGTKTQS